MKAQVETCADDLHVHAAGDSVLKEVARRLSLRLRDEDRQFVVHASMGIAVFPGDGLAGDELIRGADTAMYRARKGESCRVFFDSVERAPAGLSAARSQARERTTMK